MASLVRKSSWRDGEGVAFEAPPLGWDAVDALKRDFGAAVSAAGSEISGKPGEPGLFMVAEARPGGGSQSRFGGLWVPAGMADSVEAALVGSGHTVVR